MNLNITKNEAKIIQVALAIYSRILKKPEDGQLTEAEIDARDVCLREIYAVTEKIHNQGVKEMEIQQPRKCKCGMEVLVTYKSKGEQMEANKIPYVCRDCRELLENTNIQIQGRTSYGYRTQVAERDSWLLRWSNASRGWYVSHRLKKGVMSLDANEIAVKGTKKQVELIISQLKELPLYSNSFENLNKR